MEIKQRKEKEVIPLLFGWLFVKRSYLQSIFDRGHKSGLLETDSIIKNGRSIAKNLDETLKINEQLRIELRRLSKLIDQTQRDAYDLGYLNGTKGKDKDDNE